MDHFLSGLDHLVGLEEVDHFLSIRFLFMGHVKTICSTNPQSLEDLQTRITDVIAGIAEKQRENAFQEIQNHITL